MNAIPANKMYNTFSRQLFFVNCFLIILSWLFSSCANMGYPSGGAKDTSPPKVVKENPVNKSTHFNAKSITITFDEYIQLNDVANQVLISPAFSQLPEFKVKGKSIMIPIKEPLREQTTYTINFGSSIKDVNEGNLMEDYKYVFSTGDYVDSSKINGKVVFANNKKTEKGILVMLYDRAEDSVPMKEKPVYYSKTEAEGIFSIENIRAGQYRLFALKDQNFNMMYDLPNEPIAFWDKYLEINDTVKYYELGMFEEKKAEQKLLNAYSANYGRVYFAFSKPADSVKILSSIPSSVPELERWEYSFNRDTVTYWFSDVERDSMVFFIRSGDKIIDTAAVKIPAISKDSAVKIKISPFTPTRGSKEKLMASGHHPHQPFFIEFLHPLVQTKTEQILLLEDSMPAQQGVGISFDMLQKKMTITYPWKDTTAYTIFIPDSIFLDIYHQTNDTLQFRLRTRSSSDYGNLQVKIKRNHDTAHYFLELMDEKENVLEKITLSTEEKSMLSFKYLLPLKYLVRITHDENFNNKWDTGNYLQKKQPEKVIYYPQPINLRANWEMEVEISLNQ